MLKELCRVSPEQGCLDYTVEFDSRKDDSYKSVILL